MRAIVITEHGGPEVLSIREMPRTMFHDGERAVQRRAGVERVAAQVGRIIGSRISPDHAGFLRDQTFVVVAGRSDDCRLWATLITGPAGFAQALDERRFLLAAAPAVAIRSPGPHAAADRPRPARLGRQGDQLPPGRGAAGRLRNRRCY